MLSNASKTYGADMVEDLDKLQKLRVLSAELAGRLKQALP